MTEARPTLTVDLGGTRMRAAVVTADGVLTSRTAMATPQQAACPDALMDLVGDVLATADVGEAVIGVPGRVDHRHGRLEHAPNLPPHWPDALDEGLRGRGSWRERDLRGPRLGHRPGAPRPRRRHAPDGARIVELVHAGDPHATRVWDEVVAVIASGVANLAFLFTPEVIVLGGGVGRNGDLLVPAMRAHLDGHGPPGLPVPIDVVVAELGDDAGLVGAGAWRRATREPGNG